MKGDLKMQLLLIIGILLGFLLGIFFGYSIGRKDERTIPCPKCGFKKSWFDDK